MQREQPQHHPGCSSSSSAASITDTALFASHLQLTLTFQYQLPFPLIIHHRLLSLRWRRRRTLPARLEYLISDVRRFYFIFFFLPFGCFAVSPPLYSWGEPMKTPPTFCHMGNKSASFILIFIILSAALYLVMVYPLPRNEGVAVMTFVSR